MAKNTDSYVVSVDKLRSALGVRTKDYAVPTITTLTKKVVDDLEKLVASGAPDSETGDLVDPIIDEWVTGELAKLEADRVNHIDDAAKLVILANAFLADATEADAAATDKADGLKTEHAELMTRLRKLQLASNEGI